MTTLQNQSDDPLLYCLRSPIPMKIHFPAAVALCLILMLDFAQCGMMGGMGGGGGGGGDG